jgi:hypothetical protein
VLTAYLQGIMDRLYSEFKGKPPNAPAAPTIKKGVSRETPLSTAADCASDQSLKRPRTPTRLPPPRFSLPPLLRG